MKKKISKTLLLKKVKIASLAVSRQHDLQGAFTIDCPSGLATCATCGRTCGTRLC
jgi:hypothetical protein